MKAPRSRAPALSVGPTSAAALGQLESIIIKPSVMRGCFGDLLPPRRAREILMREWQACQDHPQRVHLSIACARHGRSELAGAGYLLDGELRFFVTPELRRLGLGRALVAALRREAEARQLDELGAWVFPENTASARLLGACGFRPGAPVRIASFERPVLHYRLALARLRVFGAAPEAVANLPF